MLLRLMLAQSVPAWPAIWLRPVFFGCFVYIAVMLLVGGLLEDDLARMPMIGRIGIRILRRIGVFKS